MNKIRIGDDVQVVSEEGIGKFNVGEKLVVCGIELDYYKVINIKNHVDYVHESKLLKL